MSFRTAFLNWAVEQFPELKSEFDGESASMRVHLAFSSFQKHVQVAIDGGDRERVLDLFDMADRVLANASKEMRSRFHVMVVEDLNFHDTKKTTRSWALELMPSRLRDEFISSLGCSADLRKTLS